MHPKGPATHLCRMATSGTGQRNDQMFKHKHVDAKIFATRDHQAPRPLVRQNYFWKVPLAIQLSSSCRTPKYFAIKDHQISPLSWGIISFEKSLIRKNPSGADFQGRPFWSTHISSAFCKMILHFLLGDIVCAFSRHALAQTSGVGGLEDSLLGDTWEGWGIQCMIICRDCSKNLSGDAHYLACCHAKIHCSQF